MPYNVLLKPQLGYRVAGKMISTWKKHQKNQNNQTSQNKVDYSHSVHSSFLRRVHFHFTDSAAFFGCGGSRFNISLSSRGFPSARSGKNHLSSTFVST